jgi:hypothetical protein
VHPFYLCASVFPKKDNKILAFAALMALTSSSSLARFIPATDLKVFNSIFSVCGPMPLISDSCDFRLPFFAAVAVVGYAKAMGFITQLLNDLQASLTFLSM